MAFLLLFFLLWFESSCGSNSNTYYIEETSYKEIPNVSGCYRDTGETHTNSDSPPHSQHIFEREDNEYFMVLEGRNWVITKDKEGKEPILIGAGGLYFVNPKLQADNGRGWRIPGTGKTYQLSITDECSELDPNLLNDLNFFFST